MNNNKTIGTLAPLSSLFSSKDLEGDKGTFSTGLVFLDWLKKTNQSAWQILPLHETQLEPGSSTRHVPSPYKSYGFGLDPKYLPQSYKNIVPSEKEKGEFVFANIDWINDYSFFCALRDYFGTDDWRIWDIDLQRRENKALNLWKEKLNEEIDKYIVLQWQLSKAYLELKEKATSLEITLVGDLPFYLSVQSPLVWAHQDLFQIEENGTMQYVSGVPDSEKAHFGRQVWGHPLYKWDSKIYREEIVKFWQTRLSYLATLFDRIRFDHAKGFFSYGVMDLNNEKADKYVKGPGAKVFEEIVNFSHQKGLLTFTEDSGENLTELRKVINKLKIPGIKIFRFALEEKKNKLNKEYAAISDYPENIVAYSTTHDTETLMGYLNNLTAVQKEKLAEISGVEYSQDNKKLARNILAAIIASPAKTVIIPIQDFLLITDRINIPGTEKPVNDSNWQFRLDIPIENLPVSLF